VRDVHQQKRHKELIQNTINNVKTMYRCVRLKNDSVLGRGSAKMGAE